MANYFVTFAIALITALIATPIAKWLAFKTGIVDHPGYRKIHYKPMPLLGGLAILAGLALSILFSGYNDGIKTILVGSTIMFLLGIIDDKISLGARLKFALPSIAALILIILGIKTTFLPDTPLDILNILFSFVWIIGVVNAFNYIDNMDGLSIGHAAISAFMFFVLAATTGQTIVAALSIALFGACLGFLRYNFKPAKIFAGDAGSMLVGFVLASISIFGSWQGENITTSLLMPALILGYPIFDATFVSILRIANSKKPWIGDKNHSSHRLKALGFGVRKTVIITYIISICLGLTAIVIRKVPFFYAVLVLLAVGMLLAVFGAILSRVPFQEKDKKKRDGN